MSKPKATPPAPTPAPDGTASEVSALIVRGRAEWQAWLARFAATRRRSGLADTVEDALAALSRSEGFAEPPPARTAPRGAATSPKQPMTSGKSKKNPH